MQPEIQDIVDMLKDLAGTGHVEISDLKTLQPFKDALGKDKRYFCAGLDKKPITRCKDEDFTKKKYFYVDIDIRKDMQDATGNIITDFEMTDIVFQIMHYLSVNGLGDFSYAVNSGNGLHLYYVGEETQTTPQEYRDAASYFFDLVDTAIAPMLLKCDRACVNIARVSRLPGSINSREKFGLEPVEVAIIVNQSQPTTHFKLKEYAQLRNENNTQLKEDEKEIKKAVVGYKKEDMRGAINDIYIGELVSNHRGTTLKQRTADVTSVQREGQNIGAYIYEPFNVIVNTGSSMFLTKERRYTPYDFVLHEICGDNKEKTRERFASNYGIKEEKKGLIPEKVEYDTVGYVYGSPVFNDLECLMSGELCVIVAKGNSGKTTFAMNILQANAQIGKKGFYINLEFDIRIVAKQRRMVLNGKTKKNLTDLAPLTDKENEEMEKYVTSYLKKFDYFNNPGGIEIDELVELLLQKQKEGYNLFVVDSFSRISGNLDEKARGKQNIAMEKLMSLCDNTGMCVILLHHTNKAGEFEGSQKIYDLARVFIRVDRDEDPRGDNATIFKLTKDKFVTNKEIKTVFKNGEYLPSL